MSEWTKTIDELTDQRNELQKHIEAKDREIAELNHDIEGMVILHGLNQAERENYAAMEKQVEELKAENEAMRAEAATLVQGYDYVPTDGKTTLILRTTLDAASVPLLAKPMMEACKNGGR